jgi:long-chain acyl-CoA synthetase
VLDYKPPTEGPVDGFPEPDDESLAALFYTSGTTGGPKGVMLTHRNLYTHALISMLSNYGGAFVHLHVLPMFHIGAIGAFYSTTMAGGTHCFLPTFNAEGVLAAVERYRATSLLLVPTMINMVVNHPNFSRYDLSSLQILVYGASPMPLSLLETAMAKFPCPFQQVYGMTEASPLLTVLQRHEHVLGSRAVRSAGRPAPGVEILVVDDFDQPVPPGTAGEVVARGATIMKGYWNRPEITAEVLRGGWLHTGDIGSFDENGYLHILDRKKDMIKTGSENVYSPEVEAMLMSHPAILEAAVIGLPHEKWGETIAAAVVLRAGEDLTANSLIQWCRERLTHFKCPTSVLFLDALPKNSAGKIQKGVLRNLYGSANTASA